MRIGILLTTLASLTLACAATGGDAGTADVV
ncbi:MAG: hypothetical protein RL199_1834, partial [Pseudomonadota bacterium]